MLKAFAALIAIALLATAGFAVTQYWEVERLQLEVKKLARDGKEAAEEKDLIKQQLEKAEKENEKKAIEVETQSRELVQLRSDAERLKNRIAELDSVVAANPEKVAKAELLALRSLKAVVEKHIDSQNRSLKELADSVPQPPSRFEEFRDKFQGKNNNEIYSKIRDCELHFYSSEWEGTSRYVHLFLICDNDFNV